MSIRQVDYTWTVSVCTFTFLVYISILFESVEISGEILNLPAIGRREGQPISASTTVNTQSRHAGCVGRDPVGVAAGFVRTADTSRSDISANPADHCYHASSLYDFSATDKRIKSCFAG